MKLMCAQTGWMCWFFHRKTTESSELRELLRLQPISLVIKKARRR